MDRAAALRAAGMLERKEWSGGEAAGPRGLPAVRSTLQQCGLLQDLIDISLSNLRGLRTKCAASNDLTQQEIRTLEVRPGLGAAAGPRCRPAPHCRGLPLLAALSPRHRGRAVPFSRCWRGQRRPGPVRSCQRARRSRRGDPGRASRGAERGAGGARTGAGQVPLCPALRGSSVRPGSAAPRGLCRAAVSLRSGMRCEAQSKGDSRLPGGRCVPTTLCCRAGKTPLCLRFLVFAPDGSCPLLQACLSIPGSIPGSVSLI